ncbi:MAG: RsmE family RNA methyltransferase, partial [Planctomycetota bacterium]
MAGTGSLSESAGVRLRVAAAAWAGLSEAGAEVVVEGDEAHHGARVLRLGAGAAVTLIDGAGGVAGAEVVAAGRGEVRCRLTEAVRREARPRPGVTVVAPAPKGPRADAMADGLAQVGASRWVVLRSERAVVEPGAGRLEKWRRRAAEASKQCGRLWDLEM